MLVSGACFGGVGEQGKVNLCSSVFHIHRGTNTNMTAVKWISETHNDAFMWTRFTMSPCSSSQIDHQSTALYEGQVHARHREKDEGRKTVKESERSYNPILFLFTLSSCLPCLCLFFSLCTLPFFSPSLRRGIQSLHWDRSSLKVIQNCIACCSLPLLPYPSLPVNPPTSTLHSLLPPLSPQGGWILLNWKQPYSKSRPVLSSSAAGLAGCPALPLWNDGRPRRRK